MSKQQSTYRSIVKSTSIFGGVQVFQILFNLIKAKFVAILIGTVGMGIAGLLTSTISVVTVLATLGLNTGAVRELAQATLEKDIEKLNRIYTIFSRWLYFSAILGVIIVIIFSSLFSKYTFGNQYYTWAFVWLSITVFLTVFTQRNNTLLQGTGRITYLAKSSVIGSVSGLLTSIPLYYFLGIKGIVPALIIAATTSFLLSSFFVSKMSLSKSNITFKQAFFEGRDIVNLGLVMMIALLMGRVVIVGVNAFISYAGSLSDVGLYNAGIAMTSQSVGLVFAAMSLDYFPRLSSISSDNLKVREMVNQQSEVTLLIILPILVAMILFAPLMIRILLSTEFNSLSSFIRLIALGTIFQAASFTISMTLLAKGDKKNYLIFNALLANSLGLIFFIIGYKFWGLNGLAIAIGVHHFIFLIIYLIFTKKLYNYSMSRKFVSILLVNICLISLVYSSIIVFPNIYGYSVGVLLLLLAIVYSIFNLNKLIGINQYYHEFIKRFKNN